MARRNSKNDSHKNSDSNAYATFLEEFDTDMDNIREEFGLGEEAAVDCVFNYLIAARYSGLTTELSGFEYSDGRDDLGIDYWIENEGFVVCQCKSCDYLTRYSAKPKQFDVTVVNELREGLSYLIDGKRDPNKAVATLRTKYLSAKEDEDADEPVVVEAVIAVLGELTAAAKDEFAKLKNDMDKENVRVSLVDWNRLSELIRGGTTEEVDIGKIKLSFTVSDKSKDILQQNDWFSAIVALDGFIDGYKQYGNSLFDMNVRARFDNSRINKKIVAGLKTDKGRTRFTHLNNGILLYVENYNLKGGCTSIKVNGAQIINGCQTVTSIYDAYQDMAGDAEAQQKIKTTKVLIKVLNKAAIKDKDMLDSIIVATNDQNPMTARNLKSNTHEQRELQKRFRDDYLPKDMRYFYVRKDNELEAAIADTTRFDKSLYQIRGTTARKQNKYRNIKNDQLAQTWLAWLGDTQDANQQAGNTVFQESSSALYRLVFEQHPTSEYWEKYKQSSFTFDKADDCFSDPAPMVFQFLTAMAFWGYVNARFERKKESRKQALDRLRAAGRLGNSADEEAESSALKDDKQFYLNRWRRNMPFTYVALISFVLSNTFGDLSLTTCRKICFCEDVKLWIEHGMTIKTAPKDFFDRQDTGLLSRVFGFVDFAVEEYLSTKYSTLLGETKIKGYLGKNDTFLQIKKNIIEQNEAQKRYSKPFKPEEGKTVFESLQDCLN